MRYEPRVYRADMGKKRLFSFRVAVKETDLWIGFDLEADRKSIMVAARDFVIGQRLIVENYILFNPEFGTSFQPLPWDKDAPSIIKKMLLAAAAANVGPMAAVAGAFAEAVGRFLVDKFGLLEVIVENGGDIWLKAHEKITVAINAPNSVLDGCVGLEFCPDQTPIGICTSSGTAGHSVSLGKADAAVAISRNAAVADAFATATGNLVKDSSDISEVINDIEIGKNLIGVVIIRGDKIAVKGDLNIKIIKKPRKN